MKLCVMRRDDKCFNTLSGMNIEVNEIQSENILIPINLKPDSIVTLASVEHPAKELKSHATNDLGKRISLRFLHPKKALSPIAINVSGSLIL